MIAPGGGSAEDMEVDSGYNGDPTPEQIMDIDATEVRITCVVCRKKWSAVELTTEIAPAPRPNESSTSQMWTPNHREILNGSYLQLCS